MIQRLAFFHDTRFFYNKIFYKKMSLKDPKPFRKCEENLQPRMLKPQF